MPTAAKSTAMKTKTSSINSTYTSDIVIFNVNICIMENIAFFGVD